MIATSICNITGSLDNMTSSLSSNTSLLGSLNSTSNCSALHEGHSDNYTNAVPTNIAVYIIAPYILNIIYYTIATLGITLNIFTITVIGLYKPMHKQWTSFFIINQSAIDTFAAVFLMFSTIFPNDLRPRTPGNLADEAMCRVWFAQVPMYIFMVDSIYGIVSVTFERFLAVVYPIWHKSKFTKGKAGIVMVISWLVGPCFYIAYAVSTSALTPDGICTIYANYHNEGLHRFSILIGFTIVYFFPLLSMFYFYARMIIVFRKKLPAPVDDVHAEKEKNLEKKNPNIIDANKSKNEYDKEGRKVNVDNLVDIPLVEDQALKGRDQGKENTTKLVNVEGGATSRVVTQLPAAPKESASTTRARHNIIKTLVIVTFGFILCWSWNQIYFLMFHMGYKYVDFTGVFFNFTVVMVFVSCCINPIIYCIKFRQFQNGILWLFGFNNIMFFKKPKVSPNSMSTVMTGTTSA